MPSWVDTCRLALYGPIAAYMFAMTSVHADEKQLTNVVRNTHYLPFVMLYLCVDGLLVALTGRSAAYKASMLVHHALLGSATAYVHFAAPHLLGAYSYASFCEVSAVLLSVHEVLERSGADKATKTVNAAATFAAHVWTRLVMHPRITALTVPRVCSASRTEWLAVTAGMVALFCLNVYWTKGMVAKARRALAA